jgi:GR25 family glycosyltransferase involved in LPS biosynthesis
MANTIVLVVSCMVFHIMGYAEDTYLHDGYYNEYDTIRFDLISLFLPFNPNISIFPEQPEMVLQCARTWPKGIISHSNQDFLWIDSPNALPLLRKVLNNPIIIYISTDSTTYKRLKAFLNSRGFSMLSHWYLKDKTGYAIFLKTEVFQAAMRSLNYDNLSPLSLAHAETNDLSSFFRKVECKPELPHIEEIDYVYMINLDERPEKFAISSSQLHQYGIYPYRFSAVNGWKLPAETFDCIGVRFTTPPQDLFMGTTYRNVQGQKYKSNELIQETASSYYTLGMSPGNIGIVLSHLSVLQDAYDSGYNTIWVMEDDVEVIEHPQQLSMYIRELDTLASGWDILFTDIDTKNRQGTRIPCRSMAARPNFPQQPLSHYLSQFYPISNQISKIGMRYGAYSMIIRRSAMNKILAYYKKYHIFLPYDMDFWLIPDLHMYTVNKDIVSTIFNALTDNRSPGYENDVP